MGLINSGCTAHQFDADRWVLRTPGGRHLLVSEAAYDLYGILGANSDWETATETFNARYGMEMEVDEFMTFSRDQFAGYRVLEGETDAQQAPALQSYVSMKTTLLPAGVAGFLASLFQPLFNARWFWFLLAALTVFGTAFIVGQYSGAFWQQEIQYWWAMTGLIALGYLMHELGHVAACRAAGSVHGEIGFGLYFMFPVMYANVSGVWTAGREQRAIVNLGGIFMEMVYCLALVAVYTTFGGIYVLGAATVLLMNLIFELNPFFRSDGYWILADLTNTPNLHKRAGVRLLEALHLRPRPLDTPQDHWWMAIYALGNTVLIGGMLTFMIYHNYSQLLAFPAVVAGAVQHWVTLDFSVKPTYAWFMYLVIYYVVGKLVFGLLKSVAGLVTKTIKSGQKNLQPAR